MTDPLAAYNAVACAIYRQLEMLPEDEHDEALWALADRLWDKMNEAEVATARLDSWLIDDALFGNTVE